MKKIGIVVPSLVNGGGVTAVARFIKDVALRSGRYEPMLVSLCMSSDDPCSLSLLNVASWSKGVSVKAGEWEGRPYAHVGAKLGELEFQRYRRRPQLENLLRDCDLIQVVSGSPAWANAVIGINKPVALQVATRTAVERSHVFNSGGVSRHLLRRIMTAIADRLDDRALQKVDAIQVENPWMFDYVKEINRCRGIDLRYAPPGVDASLFCPLPTRNIDIEPYVLCVGRLGDPRKNIQFLLEAFSRVAVSVNENVKLVLAGASEPTKEFWVRADQLNIAHRIKYIKKPSRTELISLYQHASVFALSSDEEGLGIVILEAMACAIPVVATKCGGPDGIITDGKDGYLIPLGQAETMANKLIKLLLDFELNKRVGASARQTIVERFEENVAGNVFVDMWDKLVS